MGRARLVEQYQGMRAHILEEARALVAAGEALTVRRVAQAAKCAPSVLYHYFAHLEALKEALLETAGREIGAVVLGAWREGDALRQNLRRAFHAALDMARKHPNEYRTYSVWSVCRGAETPSPLLAMLTEDVARAMAVGELISGDPRETAFLLWQGLQALNRTLADLPTERGDALLDRYVEILFEGVAQK